MRVGAVAAVFLTSVHFIIAVTATRKRRLARKEVDTKQQTCRLVQYSSKSCRYLYSGLRYPNVGSIRAHTHTHIGRSVRVAGSSSIWPNEHINELCHKLFMSEGVRDKRQEMRWANKSEEKIAKQKINKNG